MYFCIFRVYMYVYVFMYNACLGLVDTFSLATQMPKEITRQGLRDLQTRRSIQAK